MTDDLICPIPEPIKWEAQGLKVGIEMETIEHIRWRIRKEHYDNFNSVPKEKRQKVLDRLNKGGISIKDVANEFGLSADVVGDILYLNIQDIPILRRESL